MTVLAPKPAATHALRGGAFVYRWYAAGDINAFFALAFDNLALLAAMSSVLIGVFGMPAEMVLGRMVPGPALGVLCGDVIYTWLALRLARREKRQDVTAMPFGIDTPSLFALSFGVIGPAYAESHDAATAWAVGTAVLFLMGLTKIIAAFFGDALRRALPPAALIGVLSAVAVVLIMFFPFTKLMAEPIGGLVALGVVLLALVGRMRLPANLPVVPVAVVIGAAAIGLATLFGYQLPARAAAGAALGLHLPSVGSQFLSALPMALRYVPIALPIALVTVIGGVDNVQSALLAGDRYETRDILLGEGVATLVAALLGGVIQNTPYIGHPAYKAMGARAAYTLAAGVFIGLGAISGVIGLVLGALPESLLVPILIYVGIQMAAQATLAIEARYLQALPMALVPVIAYLINLQIGTVLGGAHIDLAVLPPEIKSVLLGLSMLGNGFIVTAMVWVALLVFIIDHRCTACMVLCVAAAAMTAVGLMHSPYPDSRLFWPGPDTPVQVFSLVAGYLGLGIVCFLFGRFGQSNKVCTS
jgi:AGZA family xanthine/uracil permease-like MFS transporter